MTSDAARQPIRAMAPSEASLLRSSCTLPTLTAAVEEVVLNSLDAGATEVSITVDVGALSFEVRDNGHGITPSDLKLVGDRGASSKLGSPDGRAASPMFGFRGEAIHSLAAISLVEIVSLCPGLVRAGAHSAVLHLGRRLSVGPAREARSPGTTVTVRDVFANRAVARKQLRRAGVAEAEGEAMRETLGRLAVAHPGVAFRLHDSGRDVTLLRTSRAGDELTTYRQIEGGGALPPMARLLFGDGELEVDGHVAIPPAGHRTRDLQLVCLNRRPLSRKGELHRLVEAACNRLAAALQPVERAGSGAAHGRRIAQRIPPSSASFAARTRRYTPSSRRAANSSPTPVPRGATSSGPMAGCPRSGVCWARCSTSSPPAALSSRPRPSPLSSQRSSPTAARLAAARPSTQPPSRRSPLASASAPVRRRRARDAAATSYCRRARLRRRAPRVDSASARTAPPP